MDQGPDKRLIIGGTATIGWALALMLAACHKGSGQPDLFYAGNHAQQGVQPKVQPVAAPAIQPLATDDDSNLTVVSFIDSKSKCRFLIASAVRRGIAMVKDDTYPCPPKKP